MAENQGISESDIDALLAEMNKADSAAATPTDASSTSAAQPGASVSSSADMSGEASQDEIDALLASANFDDPPQAASVSRNSAAGPSRSTGAGNPMPSAPSFQFPDLQRAVTDAQVSSIDLLKDVELNVKIELGRSRMLVEDVLRLAEGAVVELDKLAGDPVDVFVNERLVARGEVLVLNDQFCVRVNEIISNNKDDLM